MWIGNRPILTDWHGGPVVPTDILYEYDGPEIFVSRIGPATLLFYKTEEGEEADSFLIAPIDDEELTALRSGGLSIRGAMSHREAWVAEVDFRFNVKRFQEQAYSEYGSLLPIHGVPLYARFGEVPDTLEQAQAFISFKLESDLISSESVPLSILRTRIDDVARIVKSALLPPRLKHSRKARLFDPEVAPLRLDSLLIAVKEPRFDEAGLQSSKETAGFSVASLVEESEGQSAAFFSELEETTRIARGNSLTQKEADDHFELLDSMIDIVPTSRNELNRLQVSVRTSNGVKLVSIDKRAGDRMFAARKSIEAPTRAIRGVIIELNDDAGTFIVKDDTGYQTTVSPLADRYRNMEERQLLRIGQRLRVTGRLWERVRRDYMVLTEDAVELRIDDAPEN